MIERVDMTGQEMIYIKFEDSDEFIQVNTMDSAWKDIAEYGPDKPEYIERWDSSPSVDDLKMM